MPDDPATPKTRKTRKAPEPALPPEAPGQPEVVSRWVELLSEEGYRPKADRREESPQHWRILFKHEGTTYGVYLDEQDTTYTQLELAYSVDPKAAPLATLLAAANLVNAETKAVKVTVSPDGDAAWFMLEWFSEAMPSPAILERLLSQARHGADDFFEKRKELSHPEPQA